MRLSPSLSPRQPGAVEQSEKYYPYGSLRSGVITLTDKKFTGQQDEGTAFGLYDYGARFYSTVLGRFTSADPVAPRAGDPQALDRYSYARNDPELLVDPSGLYFLTACGWGQDCEHGGIGKFEKFVIEYWKNMRMFQGEEGTVFAMLKASLESGVGQRTIIDTFDVGFVDTSQNSHSIHEAAGVEAIKAFTKENPDVTYALGFSFGALSMNDYLWGLSTGQFEGQMPKGTLLIAGPTHDSLDYLGVVMAGLGAGPDDLYEGGKGRGFDAAGLNVTTVAGMNISFLGLPITTDKRNALTVNGAVNYPDLGGLGHNTHQEYAPLLMGDMMAPELLGDPSYAGACGY